MKRLVLALLLMLAGTAAASGPRVIRFDQPADCAFIGGWELFYEPVAGADVKPSPTASGASIENKPPLVCGPDANSVTALVGVGQHRFWLRAVGTNGAVSDYSNFVDASIPFAAPVLGSVGD